MKQFLLFFSICSFLVSHAQTGTQTTLTLQHDGVTREYILYVPQIYNGQIKVPLVFNLHGYGSSMGQQVFYGDFRDIADTANFILVVPNGLNDASNTRYWNFFLPNGSDDIGFLSKLIDELASQYEIDENRVYSTGMSNGGFMSYYLACNLSDKITAIASVTGTMDVNQVANCNPSKPVPTMSIHGTSDAVVSYTGDANFASVESVLAHWVDVSNCDINPIITPLPDVDPSDGCTVEHYLYPAGTNGATVEHYKVLGGGHTWPGAFINVGVTNQDFDASVEIWRFFSQYNSAELINTSEEVQFDNLVNIFPNPSEGKITIEITENIDELQIITAQGRKIKHFQNVNKGVTISDLKSGIYFVKINSKGKSFSKKLIIR